MDQKKKKNIVKAWPFYLLSVVLVVAIFWAMRKNHPNDINQPLSRTIAENLSPEEPVVNNDVVSHEPGLAEPVENATITNHRVDTDTAKPATLEEIIQGRRTWNPVGQDWLGKSVADFGFSDIKGKSHRLSEYKGKDVIVIFWATWCPPCKAEIPGLLELRSSISTDELAILAISSEHIKVVKKFAEMSGLNYTVASHQGALPKPFSFVRSIPTAFFVDKQGKIKFVTEGAVSGTEVKAILRAEK